ncbi:DUF4212 domain-containing protein [Undibacterium sp. TJN25]|uniref:DUF4212 domain-containing protein n=1 Tax=Undibacterium sp. TJN25 TaxID=3413056 RepID=UPI003BF161E5
MSDTDQQAPTSATASTTASFRHWPQTRKLSAWLLACWFVLTFGTLFFARELSGIYFFGWSLSFYMAAQGLSLFYVLILAAYSLAMRRVEKAGRSHS